MMDKELEKDVRTSWGLTPVCPSATEDTGKSTSLSGQFLKLLSTGCSPLELYMHIYMCVRVQIIYTAILLFAILYLVV